MEKQIVLTDYTLKQLTEHGTKNYPILISSGLTLSSDIGIVSLHWINQFQKLNILADSMILVITVKFFANIMEFPHSNIVIIKDTIKNLQILI